MSAWRWTILLAMLVATMIGGWVWREHRKCDVTLIQALDVQDWSSWPTVPDFGGYVLVGSHDESCAGHDLYCTREVHLAPGGACPVSDVQVYWWFTTKVGHEVGAGEIDPAYYRLSLRQSPTEPDLFVIAGLDAEGEMASGKTILVAAFRREPNAPAKR